VDWDCFEDEPVLKVRLMSIALCRGETESSEETVVQFDSDTIVPVNTRVRVLYDDGKYQESHDHATAV
jgi:hypothetical protein